MTERKGPSFGERLLSAGSSLMKLNVGDAVKAFGPTAQSVDPSKYRGGAGYWLFNQDGPGTGVHFSYNNLHSAVDAHQRCSPLTAIINRKAQAYTNGRLQVVDKEGKEVTAGVGAKVRTMLQRPNPLQTWKQFDTMVYMFTQLFGFCPVLRIMPVGLGPEYTKRVWVLPPWMCDIQEKASVNIAAAESWADFIDRFDFTWGGYSTAISLDVVFLFRDVTPSLSTPTLPESRVRANEQIISNIIGAYESRGVLIDKRGPSYVISSGQKDESGAIPMDTKEKKEVEKEFQTYGLRRGQMNAIITTAAIQVATIGFTTKDLMLFEEIEDDIMRLCDSYNYPYPLMASNRTNTLGGSNIGESKRLLYQDAIIPEAEDLCEQYALCFGLAAYGIRFVRDYKHVPALQEDKVQQATARKTLNEALALEFQNGLLTLDGWLAKLGEPALPDGRGAVYATDLKNTSVPLAVLLGVGGVQALVTVLTAQGMDPEARQATVEILFGIAPNDAARMVTQQTTTPVNPNPQA